MTPSIFVHFFIINEDYSILCIYCDTFILTTVLSWVVGHVSAAELLLAGFAICWQERKRTGLFIANVNLLQYI